jgi:hypothetical protein
MLCLRAFYRACHIRCDSLVRKPLVSDFCISITISQAALDSIPSQSTLISQRGLTFLTTLPAKHSIKQRICHEHNSSMNLRLPSRCGLAKGHTTPVMVV